MKIYESKIFDGVNSVLALIQNKLDVVRQNSFLLLNIDYFILFFLLLTFFVSTFGTTGMIGAVSIFVPLLVVLKTLMTKGQKIAIEQCNFFILIYLLICFISNFTSSLPDKSFYGFSKTFVYIIFYFALCQFFKSNKKYIVAVLFFVALLVSAESVIGIIQDSLGLENISTWQDTSYVNEEDVLTRVYGTLKPYNPNLFAGFMLVGLPSVLGIGALFLQKKKFVHAVVALGFFFAGMLTLFLTGCRGAYIGLLSVLIGIVVASYNIIFKDIAVAKLKSVWKWLVALSAGGGFGFLMLNHGILQRILSIFIMRGDSSTSFRMNVYHSAVQMFQDNPVYGIGVGNKVFREIYGLYMLSGFDALSCYCIYLEMAVESGIFSLIAYLLFVVSVLGAAVKTFFASRDYKKKVLIFSAFAAILAVLIHGFVDTIYFRPQIQYLFWTMAAIAVALVREEKTAL